ncbi:MAG: hypothetical protein IH626_17520 [Rhodospirillales bacterium]|nr:hypothetical protein [Rhodospirillales bacterium]
MRAKDNSSRGCKGCDVLAACFSRSLMRAWVFTDREEGISMDSILVKAGGVDIAAIGYPAVREAFNETLQLCVDKLSKADLTLARKILGQAALDDAEPGIHEMLADTALYSRKGPPGMRAGARRAIDRIAPKLSVKRDPLKSAIAARLGRLLSGEPAPKRGRRAVSS